MTLPAAIPDQVSIPSQSGHVAATQLWVVYVQDDRRILLQSRPVRGRHRTYEGGTVVQVRLLFQSRRDPGMSLQLAAFFGMLLNGQNGIFGKYVAEFQSRRHPGMSLQPFAHCVRAMSS
jgi:hypothetical protein